MSTAAWLTKLDTHQREDGRLVLDKPLRYRSSNERGGGRIFEVPVGFDTDLASVPWAFRRVAARWSASARAATLHDWIYRTAAVERGLADSIFWEGLRASGVNRFTAWAMWVAVWATGRSSYQGR